MKEEAEDRARREGDENLLYDQVWCVVDVDDHGRIPEFRQRADRENIFVAVSNPCFELWLLLHFFRQQGFISNKEAKRKIKNYLSISNGRIDHSPLHSHQEEAVLHAQELDFRAEKNADLHCNPTTGVWKLAVDLYAQGADQ